MKKKQLVKEAIKHPELFSAGELAYFDRWLQEKKHIKAAKIKQKEEANS
jgi:hypothetical protein